MSFKKVEATLSSAVVQNGTFTVNYPTGTNSGTFVGAYLHKLWVAGHQNIYTAPAGFTVTFGASNITITYKGATTIAAGTRVNVQFDTIGDDKKLRTDVDNTNRLWPLASHVINLGAPAAAAANNIRTSASLTAAAGATAPSGGTLVTSGVATLDVPRNVVAAWTGTAVITITGTDEYGAVVKESSASGTSLTGKKAFKTVTSIAVSSDVTLLTVGTGDVLGLPVALPQKGLVLREMEDGAIATAGTLLAADRTTATATTGDVRGTYDPNSACDGTKAFQLVAVIGDPTDKGITQYSG